MTPKAKQTMGFKVGARRADSSAIDRDMNDPLDARYTYTNRLPLAGLCSFLMHGSPLALAFATTLLYQYLVPRELRHDLKPPDEVVTISSSAMAFDHQDAQQLALRLRALRHEHVIPFAEPAPGSSTTDSGSHDSLSLDGKRAKLKHGEGVYRPLHSWVENGVRYYQVAYEFVYPDGTRESGVVPWPVHFAPGENPFTDGTPSARPHTPLPPPPPDFMPPGTLGKALRAYFPHLQFEDEG